MSPKPLRQRSVELSGYQRKVVYVRFMEGAAVEALASEFKVGVLEIEAVIRSFRP
jgi:hypothetical protein